MRTMLRVLASRPRRRLAARRLAAAQTAVAQRAGQDDTVLGLARFSPMTHP